MNDFVANGYGILSLDANNKEEVLSLYEPPGEMKD